MRGGVANIEIILDPQGSGNGNGHTSSRKTECCKICIEGECEREGEGDREGKREKVGEAGRD